MSFYALQQVNKTVYDRIAKDYFAFIAATNDPNKEPVRVFSPLTEKMMAELELIREVSRDLQKKKVEEVNKAKAEAEEREAKKESQENPEEESQTENVEVKEETQKKEE